MNSPKQMIIDMENASEVKRRITKRDPKVEAEKVAYRKKNNELFIPNTAIKGALKDASVGGKIGKLALRPFVSACIRIEPEEIGLGVKTYEIDKRPVVIIKARIIKCRPRINNWKATFTLIYDDDILTGGDEYVINLLKTAGKRIGILDYRAIKSGEFGLFEVVKWVAKRGKK